MGRAIATMVASVSLVAACSGAEESARPGGGASVVAPDHSENARFHGTLVEPAISRPDLTLQDTSGKPFSLSSRPDDEVTVVFFGYTHCPDLCPTTMADLAEARRQLPPEIRHRVTVVFVTEDPARDTPEVLRAWLDGMDSEFVGLLGGNAETKRAMQELYLPPSRIVPTPQQPVVHPEDGHHHPGDYGIDHPGIVYAFGPGGSSVIYSGGTEPPEYAEDFARLLKQDAAP